MNDHHQTEHDPQPAEPADQARHEPSAAAPSVEQQLADAQERLLRTQAELENYRKRARREYEEAQRYR